MRRLVPSRVLTVRRATSIYSSPLPLRLPDELYVKTEVILVVHCGNRAGLCSRPRGLKDARCEVASFLFGLRRARRSRYLTIAFVAIQAKPAPMPEARYWLGVHCQWMFEPTTAQKIRACMRYIVICRLLALAASQGVAPVLTQAIGCVEGI